jgi:hypothetical protein
VAFYTGRTFRTVPTVSFIDALKHAFAVETEALTPTPAEQAVVDTLAREVVRRRLTTPALLFLELCRPLTYVTAQGLHFFQPLLTTVVDVEALDVFSRFAERRGSVDVIAAAIDRLDRAGSEAGRA